MRRAVVILSAVLVVLIALVLWVMGSLHEAFYGQYAPGEGVRYCQKLGLTISHETQLRQSCLVQGSEKTLCMVSGHPQDKNIHIYGVKDLAEKDGIQIYSPGELMFTFECTKLETECFVARDDLGKRYTFVRLL